VRVARRFHFPLETLLKVRRLHEREAKRKVAAQRAGIARLDQADRATRREISAQQEALLHNQRQPHLSAAELARGWAWITYLRSTITQRQVVRAEMVRELERRQAAFRESRKQTRTIEKLRARRWDEYVRDRRRREQAAADELAQQLHCFAEDTGAPPAVRRAATGQRSVPR